MKVLIALAVLSVLIALYVVWLRPNMKQTPWGIAFLNKVEPFERILYWKSETILWARLKVLTGGILFILTQSQTIDITPLMPFVPQEHAGLVTKIWNSLPLVISVVGMIDEWLRKDTTKPLEIVAMRTDAPIEVKVAAAEASLMTAQAVEAVKEAKAV